MAENAEDRFKRAMDRLFSPAAAAPPFSIAGRDKRESGSGINSTSTMINQTSRPLMSAKNSPSGANLSGTLHRVCRPWDRGDLFRRLATFKSMTWFGKPEVAGPVNCARNGWVNVDVDLLACEGCNAMLNFPCPPAWSQHEVESAAASFSERLDSGHKALCPWKGNACSETLAQFPPTPVEVLAEAFRDRCDALYQLSALPVLSSFTVDYLKKSKGPQVEHFISQPVSKLVLPNGIPDSASITAAISAYYQAQRIISLCGWELRLLPYVVDCEDDNAEFLRKNPSSNSKIKDASLVDSGPKVWLKKPRVDKSVEMAPNQEKKCDVGSAVLDCSLCGASVGLWLFSKIPRPASWITAESLRTPVECEFSAASGIQRGSCDDQRGEKAEKSDNVTDSVTSGLSKMEPKPANVLTLQLTIAGGPRPTQLGSHNTKPMLPSSAESNPSRKDNEVMKPFEDKDIKKGAHKGSLIGNKPIAGAIGEEKRESGSSMKKRKRHRADGMDGREAMERDFLSSVDAVDTCVLSHPENSAESVGMPQTRHQNTLMSVDNSDHIMQRRVSDVGISSYKSNASPLGDAEPAVEETASDVLRDGNSNSVFEGSCCESGINEPRPEGRASSLQNRRMSNEGSTKGCKNATEALPPPVESDNFKKLFDESAREFDPILQHRHFCPWVNTSIGRGSCGWQLTLDALESTPPAVKSDSASSIYNADPLLSVRKIFTRSPTGQKAPNKQ